MFLDAIQMMQVLLLKTPMQLKSGKNSRRKFWLFVLQRKVEK